MNTRINWKEVEQTVIKLGNQDIDHLYYEFFMQTYPEHEVLEEILKCSNRDKQKLILKADSTYKDGMYPRVFIIDENMQKYYALSSYAPSTLKGKEYSEQPISGIYSVGRTTIFEELTNKINLDQIPHFDTTELLLGNPKYLEDFIDLLKNQV